MAGEGGLRRLAAGHRQDKHVRAGLCGDSRHLERAQRAGYDKLLTLPGRVDDERGVVTRAEQRAEGGQRQRLGDELVGVGEDDQFAGVVEHGSSVGVGGARGRYTAAQIQVGVQLYGP